MNQATTPSGAEARPHKWYRLPLSSGQREELNSAFRAYFQNAESSSKGQGIRQTNVVFAVLCSGIFPDGTQVALIDGDFFEYRDGEEPQPLLLVEGIPDEPGPDGPNFSKSDFQKPENIDAYDTYNT